MPSYSIFAAYLLVKNEPVPIQSSERSGFLTFLLAMGSEILVPMTDASAVTIEVAAFRRASLLGESVLHRGSARSGRWGYKLRHLPPVVLLAICRGRRPSFSRFQKFHYPLRRKLCTFLDLLFRSCWLLVFLSLVLPRSKKSIQCFPLLRIL